MNKSILILKRNNKNMFFDKITDVDIECYYNCDDENFWLRLMRKLKFPLLNYLYGNWKKSINQYETIILFDNGFSSDLSKYIKRKNKKVKLILWFWNPVMENSKKFLEDKNLDEIWTYDKDDAKKYNLKYNTQFYTKKMKSVPINKKQDIIFLGRDKGRKDIINKVKEEFQKNNVSIKTIIVEGKKDCMTYEEYIGQVQESKAILEIVLGDIKGLTIRTMESLFLKKKLITNNKDIINYDFYNSNNIFVLGEDNLDNIKEFIEKEYVEIDEKIINYYDFYEWLKRFEDDKNQL